MDYFQLRFYEQNEAQKQKYAGTGFMYEYQLQMNPLRYRDILEDKIKFLSHFPLLFFIEFSLTLTRVKIPELNSDLTLITWFLK